MGWLPKNFKLSLKPTEATHFSCGTCRLKPKIIHKSQGIKIAHIPPKCFPLYLKKDLRLYQREWAKNHPGKRKEYKERFYSKDEQRREEDRIYAKILYHKKVLRKLIQRQVLV